MSEPNENMSEKELSSESIYAKFSEWLLSMGCPHKEVNSLSKVSNLSKLWSYQQIWQNLIEHVGPKDVILTKRRQIFNDNITQCNEKNAFHVPVQVCRELTLWRQQMLLKDKVAEVEARVFAKQDSLNLIMNEVSNILVERNLSKKRLQDAKRRSFFIQHFGAELNFRKMNLLEIKTVAARDCDRHILDIESKLDEYLSVASRAHETISGSAMLRLKDRNLDPCSPADTNSYKNTVLPSVAEHDSSTSSQHIKIELVTALVRCHGSILFEQLLKRREEMCDRIEHTKDIKEKHRRTAKSVIAHTAVLHCSFSLVMVKNIFMVEQTLAWPNQFKENKSSHQSYKLPELEREQAQINARINTLLTLSVELENQEGMFKKEDEGTKMDLHNIDEDVENKSSHQSYKLPELEREQAQIDARINTLLSPSLELENQEGMFKKEDEGTKMDFDNIDEDIITKKNKLKNLIMTAVFFETKTHEVEDSLSAMFRRLHDEERITSPNSSVNNLQELYEFYVEQREMQLSDKEIIMDLKNVSEISDKSDSESSDVEDELTMCLNVFKKLDNNSDLVTQSGHNNILETVQSSLNRLTTSMPCPSLNLARNLDRLAQDIAMMNELKFVRHLKSGKRRNLNLNITELIEIMTEEEKTTEAIKMLLYANIVDLENTEQIRRICMENLKIINKNSLKHLFGIKY